MGSSSMLQQLVSSTAANKVCPQPVKRELLWSTRHLIHVTGHARGCWQVHQHLQQQAWLPHHKAVASLVRDFQYVAEQVLYGLSRRATAQFPMHDACSSAAGKQKAARAGHPAPPLTSFKQTVLQRQQWPHWPQQLGAGDSVCQQPTCFSQVRHAHTAATGTKDTHKTAEPSRSWSRVGRIHRPLFSQVGTSSSSSDGGSSRRRQAAAAAAAAAAADREDEDCDQDEVLEPTDLRNPELWYPAARSMTPRSFVAHLGPTNSGKTHAALAALAAAPTGVYCGPLRLLACEVADRLTSMGVPCNLVTGQEIRRVKGARHTACTVEMADLATMVDVAVLDEVQMLGDKGRGWSWTRVLLGLPARQLHLCGDPAAADLLEQLAADCGDTLSVKRYRRLAPLVVQAEALGGLHQVQDGDCVVAFGRKTLHKLRRTILHHMLGSSPDADGPLPDTNSNSSLEGSSSDTVPDFCAGEQPGWYSNSCSSDEDQAQQQQQQQQQQQTMAARAFQGVGMVYGALPPESRRTQAALFNARADVWPRTSVLVASDAVGMGLNLNIRRIVFTTLHKYDGVETRPLSASEIKQIAGRAGRYASGHAEGYVNVLNSEDLPLLREALATATPHVTQACLLPRFEQLEQFAFKHEESQQRRAELGRQRKRPLTFYKLLTCFASDSQLSGAYFLADMNNMMQLAKLLRQVEPHMVLADMYTCCISPASADDGPVVQALLQIAAAYAYDRCVTPDCITLPCPDQPPRSAAEMKTAEELFRVYDLYLWLHSRLGAPGVFKGQPQVLKQRQHVAELIDVALKTMGGVPSGTQCAA